MLFIRGFAGQQSTDPPDRKPGEILGAMIKAPDVTFLYVVVAFIASLAILKRFLFVPLSAILDEREKEAATAARVHEESAAELEKAIARAEHDLARARGEALAIREKLRAEGRVHLERKLSEARTAAEASIAAASDEVGSAATRASVLLPRAARDLARALAEKILGRKLAA